MPQLKFNWVDIVFITLLVRIGYISHKRGFLPEAFKLFGLIFALVLTANNYISLGEFLGKWINTEKSLNIIGSGLLFLGTLLIFKILSLVVSFLLKSENVPNINRVVGLILGLGRAALLSSILLIVAIFSPFEYLKDSVSEKSLSSPYILKVAPFVYKFAIKFYPGVESVNPLTDFLGK